MSEHQAQSARMVREMKRRKMTALDFTKMGIMQYNARLFDIKAKGIEIQSENIILENGKVSRYKRHWIARRKRGLKRPEDAMTYEEVPQKSEWLAGKLTKLGVK